MNIALRIEENTFTSNRALVMGGAIFGQSSVIIEISWTHFSRNKADMGGAITVASQSELRLNNCRFEDNFAKRFGGAINLYENITLYIQESAFTSNHAQLEGGAIIAAVAVNIKINLTYFSGNNASSMHGGAIRIQIRCQLLLTSCAFDNNLAEGSGGVISALYLTILDIIDTNFTHNKASVSAGALWASSCEVRITRCLLIANIATVYGGSLHITSKSSLVIEFTKFMNNSGLEGGAIYVHETELKTKTCTFKENSAIQKGGAIQMDYDSSIIMKNCHFFSNKAADGGAMHLFNSNYSFVSGTIFSKNMASQNGGAAHLSHSKKIVIFENITCIGNRAEFYGGCLATESAILIMKGSNVTHNNAGVVGAGIFIMDSRIQVGS